MSKIKILYIVFDFYQAGAERQTYEIDRAIDKSKYSTSILCLKDNAYVDDVWNTAYYNKKHFDLGTKIVFFDQFKPKELLFNKALRWFERSFLGRKNKDFNSKLIPFLNQFDIIHWMGEYTFLHGLPSQIMTKSLVTTMSAKFQNLNIYHCFKFDLHYNFTSGYSEDERKYEFSEFKHYTHWFLPLLFKVPFKKNKWKFIDSVGKKIGIFTRLDYYKPLNPFFLAFQKLRVVLPNVELHIFGNGDPEKAGINDTLKKLNIIESVVFRGHQNDIIETIIKEHIDVSWFQGYNNNRPAGFAGFDVCSTGTPLICWDFKENPTLPFSAIYPHYQSVDKFVEKTIEVLTNKGYAEELSNRQFNDIIENRDIDKNMHFVVSAYQGVLAQQNV